MNWLLNVKFNIFLIAANYICAILNFGRFIYYGDSFFGWLSLYCVFCATLCALGLYAREGAKFDAREDNKKKE